MRVLYLTEAVSTHDQRFIGALRTAGHEIVVGSLHPSRDRELAREIERVDPLDDDGVRETARSVDVVHAGPLNTAAALAARLRLGPLVAASWAYDLLLEAPRTAVVREAVSAALGHAALLIVDSSAVESAARSFGYKGPVARFPWGVDLDTFRPGPPVSGGEPPIVVCTRAWEPVYRVPLVVQAFARTSTDGRLVLLNDGSLHREVNRLVDVLGIRDRTVMPGHVSEDRIADALAGAHAYVSASIVDGSSISMLQALATGLPIVATDIPGNAEWLAGLPGTRLINDDDAATWARALEWCLGLDHDARQSIRAAHRAEAVVHADWRRHERTLIRAYESVGSVGERGGEN